MGRKGEASKEGEKAALGAFTILYNLRNWLGEDTFTKVLSRFFPLVFKEGHTPIQLVCLPRLPAIKITKYALKNLTAGPLLAKYWDSSKLGIFSHSVSI